MPPPPARTRAATAPALALVLAAALAACAPLAPVARYPWVEDPDLELAGERLSIDVSGREAHVDAVFRFRSHGAPEPRVMLFPVPPGGPVTGFSAALAGPAAAPEALATWPDDGFALPAGEELARYAIAVPGDALARHGGVLRVRYRQVAGARFAYTLRSGAYWRGPIGRLDVIVRDPEGRARWALVEGEPPHRRGPGAAYWSFQDIEPRSGVALEVR